MKWESALERERLLATDVNQIVNEQVNYRFNQLTLDVTQFEHMETDPKFFDRADAHIHLSNEQMSEVTRGKVSASMMYAAARFNAWLSACGFDSGHEMARAKGETLEYFVAEYRKMLEENLDEYIEKFEQHMKARSASGGNSDV